MKILVTGGAGFIGSHIVDAYLEDGHEVVVIDNLSTGRKENLNPRARFYQLDICSPEIAEIFMRERPQILNHHAAQIDVRKSVADPHFDCRVNVLGFLNCVEAGQKCGMKRILFASSGGTVYGEQQTFPATEEHPTHPVSPYGVAKLTCEKYLYFYFKNYGISSVSLRYANIYGPRQSPHGEAGVVAIFINKMLAGEQPIINGDGTQTRDYVFVGDVVELNRKFLHGESSEGFNIGTGVEIDVNTLFSLLCKECEVSLEKKYGKAKEGEQLRSVIVSQRLGGLYGAPSTTIKDGLRKTVAWFRQKR